MKNSLFILFLLISSNLIANNDYSDIGKTFNIYTNNVEVNSVISRTLEMHSDSKEFRLKLEPIKDGHVAFALSDIRFRSTLRMSNLLFRIKVQGFVDGIEVDPIFAVDGNNEQVHIDSSDIFFEYINGAIPVWFEESVDSVMLTYSNSLGMDLDQNIYIDDLRIIPDKNIIRNPIIQSEKGHNIMIAIDGSSSITSKDRRYIYKGVKTLINELEFTESDSAVTIVDFGTEIYQSAEVGKKRKSKAELKRIVKKNFEKSGSRYTNWSSPMEYAIEHKPKVLIIMTDGWSNYYNGQVNFFSSHFLELMSLSNKLKSQGTRIVFITSGLSHENGCDKVLSQLIDGKGTRLYNDASQEQNLKDIELITLNSFSDLIHIPLENLVK